MSENFFSIFNPARHFLSSFILPYLSDISDRACLILALLDVKEFSEEEEMERILSICYLQYRQYLPDLLIQQIPFIMVFFSLIPLRWPNIYFRKCCRIKEVFSYEKFDIPSYVKLQERLEKIRRRFEIYGEIKRAMKIEEEEENNGQQMGRTDNLLRHGGTCVMYSSEISLNTHGCFHLVNFDEDFLVKLVGSINSTFDSLNREDEQEGIRFSMMTDMTVHDHIHLDCRCLEMYNDAGFCNFTLRRNIIKSSDYSREKYHGTKANICCFFSI